VPAVERDLAIVVAESQSAAAVETVLRSRGGELLRTLRLFDIYRGSPLAPDEKSLAFRLVFQAAERTLTESEVDDLIDGIADGLGAEVGGRLRA
jgi:phenylalanyl-tRNA synthetase beta chain